jgi:hypothetical protein
MIVTQNTDVKGIHERYVFITPKTRNGMENLGSLDTASVWGLNLTLEAFLPSLAFSSPLSIHGRPNRAR